MNFHFVDYINHIEYKSILRDARRNPTRRLSQRREFEVPVEALCQPFDIKGRIGPARLLIGTPESGHFEHTLESALPAFDAVLDAGIGKFCLRLIKSFVEPERAIDEHASLIAAIRRRVGADVDLTVDPFSLALTPDLQWGVFSTAPGMLDVEATLDLVATSAVRFIQAGADGYLTLGRIPYEARVARAAIDAHGLKARVVSFSTNSETPNAYINDRKPGATPRDTGQKIFVGNENEMILRALLDVDEGTDVITNKPIEAFHIVSALRALLTGDLPLETFLARSRVQRLLDRNPGLRRRVEGLKGRFAARAANVRLAAYTVSGTYSQFKAIEQRQGVPMAFAVLDELYANCLAAGGDRFDTIIDRNAFWFVQNRHEVRHEVREAALASAS